eukprot:GEMP01013333.1.p1 GENE.GEMP01013333.1~~GEMP01013333.1.p1  ORF type:complete len:566 (+),score=124.31 GEMP01013333.1:52-1698(+)
MTHRVDALTNHVVSSNPCNGNLLDFANFNPKTASGANPCRLHNLINGEWKESRVMMPLVDPLNAENFIYMPNTKPDEIGPFLDKIRSIPKSGLHNPLKNKERYLLYGKVSMACAVEMGKPEVADHFARTIQRCCPKSYVQSMGEVQITRSFLENFSGDQVRFLARGFHVSGDHEGQQSHGYRWPFGAVAIVSPFNFPLEIPTLQLMGALFMGNHVTIKCATTTSVVMEEFIRLFIKCGGPITDINFIQGGGATMGKLIEEACKTNSLRTMQFTGSNGVAKTLIQVTNGKVRIEDAGFDWKIMGPDVNDLPYVAWVCDQDAYAHTGQKCSAQSIVFVHSNWVKAGLLDEMKKIASERSLSNLTIGPVLSETTEKILGQVQKMLKIPGAKVMWGAKELQNHTIPKCYGAVEPTAIFVPLDELLKEEHFEDCTTEIFGPYQVITEWNSEAGLQKVLEACERMDNHLTAAVVSMDPLFTDRVLQHTVNGTTYAGLRARTTGAPQNHWFGPAGDPRGAGIGSPEAIRLVWSCHREIITDIGPVTTDWKRPPPS